MIPQSQRFAPVGLASAAKLGSVQARRPWRPCQLFQLIALVGIARCAMATDLGVIGPVYEISEPHFLRMIEQRLLEKQRSGELARIEQETRQRGIEAVRQPEPVSGIVTTQAPRTFYFDPTFTLQRNVLGSKGELLYPAGTRKNPLEIVSLHRPLLFIDARDRRQVASASALIARSEGRVKPVLTGGSYLALMAAWRIPVYYDQHGALTRRLGIRQVPALVTQQGQRLRIDEMVVAP